MHIVNLKIIALPETLNLIVTPPFNTITKTSQQNEYLFAVSSHC